MRDFGLGMSLALCEYDDLLTKVNCPESLRTIFLLLRTLRCTASEEPTQVGGP
jgi:hypothetical protein